MFSLSPALYRQPQTKANTVSLPLLLISPLRDVINGTNIMFWSAVWQHNSRPAYDLSVSDKGKREVTFLWKMIMASPMCWLRSPYGSSAKWTTVWVCHMCFSNPNTRSGIFHFSLKSCCESSGDVLFFYLLWAESHWRVPPSPRMCCHHLRTHGTGPL